MPKGRSERELAEMDLFFKWSITLTNVTMLCVCAPIAVSAGVGEARVSKVSPGFVERLLRETPGPFSAVMAEASRHRLQVLVTAVEPNVGQDGAVSTIRDGFRADAEYFYPASAIKLCLAVAALTELSARRLSLDEPLSIGARTMTPRRSLREMLVVSDNHAFDWLYDLTGHREAHERLWRSGTGSVRLAHRLGQGFTPEENRQTPEVRFKGAVVIPSRKSDLDVAPIASSGTTVGHAHLDPKLRSLRASPMDFSAKNAVSLSELQALLVALVLPEVRGEGAVPGLTDGDRRTLLSLLGEDARGLLGVNYDPSRHAETHFRPTLAGVLRVVGREHLEVYGKAGRAYGFHVENTFYRDRRTGRGFFVTAVLYANADEVVNDDKYDYATVSEPFFVALGEALARGLLVGGAMEKGATVSGSSRPPD